MSRERVEEIDFWKERIANATAEHHSVYLCNDRLWEQIYKNHKNIIKGLIKPNDYVLDAGCGYGRMSELFKPSYYEGVDFSPDFIKLAIKKYPDHAFEVGNLKQLPYEDKQFDWAICVSIKDMIKKYDSRKTWQDIEKELKRVADKVLILEYTNSDMFEII